MPPPQRHLRSALGRLQFTLFLRKYSKFSTCNSRKNDCRQWYRMYWIYVKCAIWLLNVRDFSFCITRRHVLESNVVHHGSRVTLLLSNGSGISANYYSTLSTSDMKHCESVTRSSKMYASWPAINRTVGCPLQIQSRSALRRLQVTLFLRKYSKLSARNSRKKRLSLVV